MIVTALQATANALSANKNVYVMKASSTLTAAKKSQNFSPTFPKHYQSAPDHGDIFIYLSIVLNIFQNKPLYFQKMSLEMQFSTSNLHKQLSVMLCYWKALQTILCQVNKKPQA